MARSGLGASEYAARFVRRRSKLGPAVPLGETPAISGSWGRKLLATTDCSVVFGLTGDRGCAPLLAQLDPWRDEIELWRLASNDLVWAGPVTNVVANPASATATVTAKDLSAWFAKRVLPTLISRGEDLAVIFQRYIEACFALDDPGIMVTATPCGIVGDRTVAAADAKKLSNELDELAKTGVDWTVAAREFFVGGTEISAGRLAGRLTDEHFRDAPQTRRSGDGQVNDATIRGNKVTGHYGGPDSSDGVLLQDVADQQSIEDQASADAAARTWHDHAAEPLIYLEGSSVLSPSAPVSIQELIPGLVAYIDVSGGGVVPLAQDLRMESLSVDFSADDERVTPAFQPVGTTGAAA